MTEPTPEQAKAYLKTRQRIEDAIKEAHNPWRGATIGYLTDELKSLKLRFPYTEEDLARALYGDDYL